MKKSILYSFLFVLLIIPVMAREEIEEPIVPTTKLQKKDDRSVVEIGAAQEEVTEGSESFFKIDVEEKRKDLVALVKKGIDYFTAHRNEQAFNAFYNDRNFVRGDVSIFVVDVGGVVYVRDDVSDIWKNFKQVKNVHGIPVVDLLVGKAQQGGGWVDYEWNNDYKSSYVEKIEKDGVTYVIGAGWYPVSKRFAVEEMVKSAVAYFDQQGRERAFYDFSNKIGKFVQGDLYIYVYDLNGYCFAHGDNSALIGRDLINAKDDAGAFITKELIAKAKKDGAGWVNYKWKKAAKVAYVEKVKDETGEYIIGSGYYPDTNRGAVVALVKSGVKYFNAWGRVTATTQFNSKVGDFIYGDLSLFMYNFDGTVLASVDNPDLVGQNFLDFKNQYGRFVTKEMIEAAKKGSGWVEYHLKNSFQVAYVEKVSDKQGEYLIGAGFYPDTPVEKVLDLVRTGANYLQTKSKNVAMQAFTQAGEQFIQGSYHLFVFNFKGDCLAYGENKSLIWKNFMQFKDSEGKQVMKLLMQKAESGGGWVSYKSRNAIKVAYVQKVEKDGVPYLIGSAFYK